MDQSLGEGITNPNSNQSRNSPIGQQPFAASSLLGSREVNMQENNGMRLTCVGWYEDSCENYVPDFRNYKGGDFGEKYRYKTSKKLGIRISSLMCLGRNCSKLHRCKIILKGKVKHVNICTECMSLRNTKSHRNLVKKGDDISKNKEEEAKKKIKPKIKRKNVNIINKSRKINTKPVSK